MGVIENFIGRRYGFDPDALGSRAVTRVIKTRMERHSLNNEDAYLALLRQSRDERNALLDALVIPETWFFRDPKAFELLQSTARDEWLRDPSGRIIRGLSAGCCTGEEAYSIVMALMDAGLSPHRFQVDAFDISPTLINKAKSGLYGERSFRAEDLSYRNRYFKETPNGHRIDPLLQERVTFHQANLINPKTLNLPETYDFIFCRNVIIYLNREARIHVMRRLEESLRVGGLLFLGATETLQATSPTLRLESAPMSFAFRKLSPEEAHPKPTITKSVFTKPARTNSHPKPSAASLSTHTTVQPASPSPNSPSASFSDEFANAFKAARQSADRGRLDQAFAQCRQLLRDFGPRPEVYTLMGLMHQSRDEANEAEFHYNKALYLNPNHYEALIHLSYLMLRKGDAKKADDLRQKAERAFRLKHDFAVEEYQP